MATVREHYENDDVLLTCFLEFEPETVKVHDIVYKKEDSAWRLHKSFYRKIRLSRPWVEEQLWRAGFSGVASTMDGGLVTVVATK